MGGAWEVGGALVGVGKGGRGFGRGRALREMGVAKGGQGFWGVSRGKGGWGLRVGRARVAAGAGLLTAVCADLHADLHIDPLAPEQGLLPSPAAGGRGPESPLATPTVSVIIGLPAVP